MPYRFSRSATPSECNSTLYCGTLHRARAQSPRFVSALKRLYAKNSAPDACTLAINSTIFKADLQVNDTDRDYYQLHKLTLARHPSETDERLMLRLLVFAMHADEYVEFAGSISSEETPALWKKNLSGEIQLWIELGQPDEKRIRKACGRSRQVYVYCYNSQKAKPWWQGMKSSLDRFDNLEVIFLPDESVKTLASMAQRTMQLVCLIQDGEVTFSDDQHDAAITPEAWLSLSSK
jgi:uncharacterized protein YaeQ